MMSFKDVGCSGGSCPKQEMCSRYLDKDNRQILLTTPPFNRYEGGKIECNYYEKKKD